MHPLLASSLMSPWLLLAQQTAPPPTACAPSPLPEPVVSIDIAGTERPPIDRSLNSLELTYYAKQLGSRHGRNGRVLGLTKVAFSYRVGPLRFAGVIQGQLLCVYPVEVAVRLEARQEILMIKTTKEGSCWHEFILEHEMQHVAYNNEALQIAAESLPARLRVLVAAGAEPGPPADDIPAAAPAPAPNLDVVGQDLARTAGEVVRTALEEAVQTIQAKHAALDAPGGGNRLRARCLR